VMLSFTTDPYPPQHHDLTRWHRLRTRRAESCP
jgi:hypothetical protein